MQVDMTPVLSGNTDTISFEFEYSERPDSLPDITLTKPIRVFGKVVNRSGYMLLTLNAEVEYDTACARCLSAVHRELSLCTDKNVAVGSQNEDEEKDDYVFIQNSKLDITEPTEELLFLEIPSRDLCQEDCKGLCPKCGTNLSLGSCTCKTREIDPRLAVLAKFLDNDNE